MSSTADPDPNTGSILHAPPPQKQKTDLWTQFKTLSPKREVGRLSEGKIPCARQSLLQGIGTLAAISAVGIISRRSMRSSLNWGVGSFLVVSIVSFQTCRQARIREAARMKVVREEFKKRRGQPASSRAEPSLPNHTSAPER